MKEKRIFLAIDIGASSGRHVIKSEGRIIEVYRFINGIEKSLKDELIWNIDHLFEEVLVGIKKAYEFYDIDAIGIDTWAVDYVLLDQNDTPIYPVYAYRHQRGQAVIDEVHAKIPFNKLYERTGTQFQPFNTIYQMYDDLKRHRLNKARSFLMIPEYLIYRLTDVKVHEFTNATTTGLLNIHNHDYDYEIIERLGFSKYLFTKPREPGLFFPMKEAYLKENKFPTKVALVATHDTASAVHGVEIPMDSLYLSSGTWSLLGIKTINPIINKQARTFNFTHEGGLGYTRFQKNIMGLWMIQRLQVEFEIKDINQVIELAKSSSNIPFIDVNHPCFLSPSSMKTAIDHYLEERQMIINFDVKDYFGIAFHSLAMAYQQAIKEIENITKNSYQTLYVFGGGAKNDFLNTLIKNYSNKQVISIPVEATAIGSIKIMEDHYNESI